MGNDPETVVVQLPLRTFKLLDVAAAALRDETNEVTKLESVVLKTCVAQWSTLRRGIVVKIIRNTIKPKVATSRKPASPASSSADVPAVHDDDVLEVPEGPVDHDVEAEVEDTLEDEFEMGVLGVGPKGLDKDLPQDALVVDCEDEAHGETDSAATAFETIRPHDAYPDVLSAIDAAHTSGKLRHAEARARLKEENTKPVDRHTLSLVRAHTPGDDGGTLILLVRWERLATREGRPVRIDQFNRVIFHFLGQADFSGAEIVIADVGVSMTKDTRAFQAQLPEWVVTVWRTEEAALHAGHVLGIACSSCLHSLEARGEPSALAYDGGVFQCSNVLARFPCEVRRSDGRAHQGQPWVSSWRGWAGHGTFHVLPLWAKAGDLVQQTIEQIEHRASTVDIACSAKRRKTSINNLTHHTLDTHTQTCTATCPLIRTLHALTYTQTK